MTQPPGFDHDPVSPPPDTDTTPPHHPSPALADGSRLTDHPGTRSRPLVALSVKQPWAALIVAGLKTVEVRKWPTRRRGRVLIHAGKLADDRPEGWARIVTPELAEAARLRGGIVGVGEIAGCRGYETAAAFAADCDAHLNAPDWFVPPRLFGFVLRDVRPVTFYPYPGQTMFFAVDGYALPESGM